MLRNAKELEQYALRATDGDIGQVKDFYFDDQHWNVRYLVIQTGHWLASRKVLISPEAVSGQLWADRVIPVNLTRDQVRNSPGIDTDRPVSRQHETELRQYYGWPPYWGPVFPEAGIAPAFTPPLIPAEPAGPRRDEAAGESSHLQSARDVASYHIEATDGALGHVDDFLIDDSRWRIRYLVIDTRNWLPGRKVIVSPAWIREVSWPDAKVFVGLTRDAIKGSPDYDPEKPFTAEYAAQLHDHYGRPRYDWEMEAASHEKRTDYGV